MDRFKARIERHLLIFRGSSYIIPSYQRCPLGVVRGSVCQPLKASSVNQTVKLPRWCKLASYVRELMTLCFCLGMWRRRS